MPRSGTRRKTVKASGITVEGLWLSDGQAYSAFIQTSDSKRDLCRFSGAIPHQRFQPVGHFENSEITVTSHSRRVIWGMFHLDTMCDELDPISTC